MTHENHKENVCEVIGQTNRRGGTRETNLCGGMIGQTNGRGGTRGTFVGE